MAKPFVPATPGTIEVVIRFKLFGIPIVLTIGVRLGTAVAPTQAIVDDLALLVDTWVQSHLLTHLSQELTLVQVQATDLASSTGPQGTVSHSPGIAGGITAQSLPSQCAQVVSFYTALRGRSYRGRNYLAGLSLGDYSGANVMAGGRIGNFLSDYQALNAALLAASYHHVVISSVASKAARPVRLTADVTSYVCDGKIETQRRRSEGAHSTV